MTDNGHDLAMATVTIDAGTLTASREDRQLTGLLLPYGEECRSNIGTFTVDPGVFTIPEDPAGTVGLNVEHRREDSAGRAVTLTETPQGVVATFSVARGPKGDQLLDDVATGRRRHLSVEASGIRIRDHRAVAGEIFGAAVVAEPAFPSAVLLAAAADTEDPPPADPPPAEDTPPAPDSPPDPPADPDPDESDDETEMEPDMNGTTATAPDTLHAARPAAPAVPDTSLARFTTLMASRNRLGADFTRTIANDFAGADTLFAALSDVKISGTPGAGIGGPQLPQVLGELWTRVAYQRRIVPLMLNAALTSLTVQGWRWTVPPAVAPWAGNKSDVPSPAVTTEAATETAQRLAAAYDVAREYVDFDVPGFWESFWNALTASYAKQSDDLALASLVSASTEVAQPAPVAGVNQVVADVIAGVSHVIQYGTPGFAVTSPEQFASVAGIVNAGSFPYLSVGEVQFPVYGPSVTIAGIPVIPGEVGEGATLVAAREAATFYELPGSPIRVEGVYDMARGGVNPGMFGYFATMVHQPNAIALVGPAAAPLAARTTSK